MISIDASAFNDTPSGLTCAVTLSTSTPDDAIIVFMEANGGTPSISDTAGLNWTLRLNQPSSQSSAYIAEFWAPSAGLLSSDVITLSTGGNTTYIAVSAFAIAGTNYTSPFDTNASLPAGVTTGDVTLSTTAATTFIIGCYRLGVDPGTPPGAPWATVNFGQGGAEFMMDVEQLVTSAQTNLDVPGGSANSANGGIADALIPAPVSPTLGAAPGGAADTEEENTSWRRYLAWSKARWEKRLAEKAKNAPKSVSQIPSVPKTVTIPPALPSKVDLLQKNLAAVRAQADIDSQSIQLGQAVQAAIQTRDDDEDDAITALLW